jgi:hypothetical protein
LYGTKQKEVRWWLRFRVRYPLLVSGVCVGCLFLRSPSRIPYRTELIPRAPNGGVPGPPTRNPSPRIRSCRGHTPPQSAVSW